MASSPGLCIKVYTVSHSIGLNRTHAFLNARSSQARLPMVSAKPLTIGLNQSNGLIVRPISDWFNNFLNSSGSVRLLNRLSRLIVDY